MISVTEAEQRILSHLSPLESILLPITQLAAHILREPCYADRPYPPFHRVAMDGIAIKNDQARRHWPIQTLQKAGEEPKILSSDAFCIEIMTGAKLPEACDTVIRYEDLELRDGIAYLKPGVELKVGAHIHRKGADCAQNARLIESDRRITAPLAGILAAIGKAQVRVTRLPRVAIISTGDELVSVEEQAASHQIRASNASALREALGSLGIYDCQCLRVADQVELMRETFAQALASHDVLLITGGVSAGKLDFVPQILHSLQVTEIFHKVRQKPGKPLWFGVGKNQQTVFGLPGNPQSALVCFIRYVEPALRTLMSRKSPAYRLCAKLMTAPYTKPSQLTQFVPVRVSQGQDAALQAYTLAHQGSGDFVALADSDGVLELAEMQAFEEGRAYPLYLWQSL